MRVQVAIPEAHVDAPVLDAALESVTRLNESLLKEGAVPTAKELIARGAQWKPEPPGEEHFDHGATIAKRGHGDCDDWAPLHAASLRHTGEDPGAKARVYRSGPKRWHAIVERSNGAIDDPSRWAGMGTNGHGVSGFDVVGFDSSEGYGVVGATAPLMYDPPSALVGSVGAYIVRPAIAVRPVRGGFQARADIPWLWREHLHDEPKASDYAMTALHTAPVASTALSGCLNGAITFADVVGFSSEEHLRRLACIADRVSGADFDELANVYGTEEAYAVDEIVGSLFGGLGKMLKKVASPLAHIAEKAVAFVPGVGPIASMALHEGNKMLDHALQSHPGAPAAHGPAVVVPAGAPPPAGMIPFHGGGPAAFHGGDEPGGFAVVHHHLFH
jgi:hypothetical protein